MTLDYSHFPSEKTETEQKKQIVLDHRAPKQMEDSSPGLVSSKGLWLHETEQRLSLDDSEMALMEEKTVWVIYGTEEKAS